MDVIKAKLMAKDQLTENIFRLRFKLKEGELNFVPGQYVLIEREFAGEKIKRAYSISTRPEELPIFELTVRRFEGGRMSTFLTDLNLDEELEMQGPLGIFTGQLGKNKEKVLIAIGCGIAPLKSILQHWLTDTSFLVSLFYGNRFLQDIPYHDYFIELKKKYDNFYYYPCVSRPETSVDGIFTGRVYDVMAEQVIDFSGKDYYLCGSREMISQVREFLVTRGVDGKNIYFEQIFI